MRVVLVGYGKMGQLVGELAPQYGCEVAGVIDPVSPRHGGGADAACWNGVDVAIDFSIAESIVTNLPVLARRGIDLVVGTTGWTAHEPALRKVVDEAGVGVVVAPNFSTGVVIFEAIVARASALFAAQPEFGAFLHHHADFGSPLVAAHVAAHHLGGRMTDAAGALHHVLTGAVRQSLRAGGPGHQHRGGEPQ